AFNNQFDAAGYILPGKYKPMYYISQKQAKATIIQIDTEKLNTESKQIDIAIDQEFKPNYKTQNVIGYIQGKSDSIIMFTAHYDHLGGMGNKVFFPGANDNCSGVSMLLSLAEYYNTNKIKPEYTLVFAFLSAEEVGLRGSMYMALHPPFNLKRVKFLFNLDLVGTGSEGIQIVNSTVFDKEYNLLCKLNDKNSYLKQIKKRGEAANSDHYPFYAIGIPAFFIYTLGGTSEYHNPLDISKTLPLTKYKELFSLLTDFIDNYE
ncbi:MAG: aminopeptidase, partial [Marinilabiliales bacterium]